MSCSWKNIALPKLGVRSFTLLALEGQSESRASLPYSAIVLSLAQGRQLGFLKSKVMAIADLVSSPQYAGLNEFDLFCVCAFV